MSAYGNLASAKTDIGRNLSDIAGIGIEMEYGSEGRIAGQMEQSRIANQTAVIGLGLESIQQFASMGVSAEKEAARAKEMGELAGGYEQTKGETRLWDLFRGKADIDTAGGETFWGEVGERIGTGLGFMDREYEMGGRTYTSSQIEAGSPWAKLGKDWEEVSQLMGGGTKIGGVGDTGGIGALSTSTGGTSASQSETHYKESTMIDGREQTVVPETQLSNSIRDSLRPKKVSYGEALQNREMYQTYLSKFHESGFTSEDDWYSLFQ